MNRFLSAYFLVGPTATGKTRVAHRLAQRLAYDILSADSMAVYQGMDIGTAKPTPAQRHEVTYHGLDWVTPDQPFSVWEYLRRAREVIAEAVRANRSVIVVGGSGLYVKALTDGLAPVPGADPDLRGYWEAVLRERGSEALAEALREKSPRLYGALRDRRNPRRLIRALELAEAGVESPVRAWSCPSAHGTLVGLTAPPEELNARIAQRVRAMFEGGLLDEVRTLLKTWPSLSPTARQAIGYAEALSAIAGECPIEEAMERAISRTRHLAKRQRTWFCRQASVRWIDVQGLSVEAVMERVLAHWQATGPTPLADPLPDPASGESRRVRDLPASLRPREEIERRGVRNVSDSTLLAVLLRTGTAGRNVMDLAHDLLRQYGGSWSTLADAPLEELQTSIRGMGRVKAIGLHAALEIGRRLFAERIQERPTMRTAADAVRLLQPYAQGRHQEAFWVILLDTRHRVKGTPVEVTRGLVDASLVHPRELFRQAIRAAATAVMLGHNHPSGDPTPSAEDIRITQKVVDAGRVVDIKVLDHVILGQPGAGKGRSFVSLREAGLVDFA